MLLLLLLDLLLLFSGTIQQMNILVTGGAGFIGSHFVLRHAEQHPEDALVVLDKLTYAGDRSLLDPMQDQMTFIEGDIADMNLLTKIVDENQIDTIVNFAAETHVDNSIQDVSPFIQANIIGVHNMIELCRTNPDLLLVHISTDEVYGDLQDDDPVFSLESPLRPSNPYSATKAAGDMLIIAAVRTHGIRARITRCSNNFGPHQASEKFWPTVIGNALNDQSIPIYGSGEQKRDWLYVTNHTDAVEKVISNGIDGEIYLISDTNETTNLEVAQMIVEKLGKSPDLITHVDDRPGHDWRYALDASSARALGWEPAVGFEEGVERTIEWYVEKIK